MQDLQDTEDGRTYGKREVEKVQETNDVNEEKEAERKGRKTRDLGLRGWGNLRFT